MNAAPKVKLLPFELEVISGPHLGQKFSFVDVVSVSIGRGAENQICLQHDPRVSRVHAEIKQENEVFYIFNRTDKNSMLINGLKETQFKITQSCVITIGETEFKFIYPQVTPKPLKNPLQPLAPNPIPVGLTPYQGPVTPNTMARGNPSAPPKRRRPTPKKASGFNPIILIGLVAIAVIGFLLLPSKPDATSRLQPTLEIIPSVTQDERRYQESLERARNAISKFENQSSRQTLAQQFFVSGMREFLNGNYHRAISLLSSAYQGDPTLVDAEKFAREAQRKLDRLIDFYFAEGIKYRENSNFRMCKSSFQTVLLYVRNTPKHPRFLEAKQFFEECMNLDKVRRF